MNMKPYLDAVNSASAQVSETARQIDELFTAGKTEDALKLQPQLDAAKVTYDKSNALYLSMLNATSPDTAQRVGVGLQVTTDAGDQPFESIGDQLVAVKRFYASNGRTVDHRLDGRRVNAALGQNETVGSEGGFLVDETFVPELLERTYDEGVLASRVTRQPIGLNSNRFSQNMLDETSRANGSRYGGITVYWSGEAATISASGAMKFRKFELSLDKLAGLVYATDESLEDAVQLTGIINRAFPKEFAFKLDDGIINGPGAGAPLGVLNSPALISVTKETGQAADTVVTENVVKMWARMRAANRMNAVWYINQDIEPQLYTMNLAVGSGGMPVYMPPGGLSEAPYGRLMGRPVIPIEQAATLGDAGDIILADLGEYIVIDKGGIKTASSIHVQFVTEQTAFRFTYRVNGAPLWNAPLTPYKGTGNTQSPFVALAAR